MDWPTLIFTALDIAQTAPVPTPSPTLTAITESARATAGATATATPSPSPTGTGGPGTTDKPADLLPLWVGITTGVIGLVGTLGAQFIAAWKENNRLKNQNLREDQLRKRNELTTLYTALLSNFDNYVAAMTLHKGGKVAVESLSGIAHSTPGVSEILDKAQSYSEQMLSYATSIASQLQLLDLLGETYVYEKAFAYFGAIKKLEPKNEEIMGAIREFRLWMQAAMKESLTNVAKDLPPGTSALKLTELPAAEAPARETPAAIT